MPINTQKKKDELILDLTNENMDKLTTKKADNDNTDPIPDGANAIEKRVYEAGLMLEEFSDFSKKVGASLAKIPGVGIAAELITGIISSICHALSQLLEKCVKIAIEHDDKETVDKLKQHSDKLDQFAKKHNLVKDKEVIDNVVDAKADSQHQSENKHALNKEQKIDDKIAEAGEMVSELGPLVREICSSLSAIPGVGVVATLVGSIADPVITALGDLIQKLASIDSNVSASPEEHGDLALSSMKNTSNTMHDAASLKELPSIPKTETATNGANSSVSNADNVTDMDEPVQCAVQ